MFRKDMYENSIEYLFASWTTGLNCKDGFLRLLEGGCGEVTKNGVGTKRDLRGYSLGSLLCSFNINYFNHFVLPE